MQSNRKVAFNNFSLSFFFSMHFWNWKTKYNKAVLLVVTPQTPTFVSCPLFYRIVKSAYFMSSLGFLQIFLLCIEVGAREATWKDLYRIPQKSCFLTSHGSSIEHPLPIEPSGVEQKYRNVPEALTADWNYNSFRSDFLCLIFICICSVGRHSSYTQSVLLSVPSTSIVPVKPSQKPPTSTRIQTRT